MLVLEIRHSWKGLPKLPSNWRHSWKTGVWGFCWGNFCIELGTIKSIPDNPIFEVMWGTEFPARAQTSQKFQYVEVILAVKGGGGCCVRRQFANNGILQHSVEILQRNHKAHQ